MSGSGDTVPTTPGDVDRPSAAADGSAISVFRLRPNATPQLLAKFASVLVALARAAAGAGAPVTFVLVVASGDVGAMWYDAVRRRAESTLDMSSDIEPAGLGEEKPALSSGGLSMNGSPMEGSSEIAVVGDALAVVAPDDATGKAGRGVGRAEKDIRDAREIGRKGVGTFDGVGTAAPEVDAPPAPLTAMRLELGVGGDRNGVIASSATGGCTSSCSSRAGAPSPAPGP